MTKQEQIKEMKNILNDYAIKNNLCFSYDVHEQHAKTLVNAGFGNVQAILQELYNIVKDADCTITIDTNDVIKLAKRYNIKITK